MSFIHYKLITNQSYEKVTFDGVSLSVGELKKIIIEKKFRKGGGSSSAASSLSNGAMMQPHRKMNDVDLEVTNVDSNEGYYLYYLIFFIVKKIFLSFFKEENFQKQLTLYFAMYHI